MLIKVSGSEQVTSTTVPGSTGNCVVVSNLLPHSVGSPVQASTGLKRSYSSIIYREAKMCLKL